MNKTIIFAIIILMANFAHAQNEDSVFKDSSKIVDLTEVTVYNSKKVNKATDYFKSNQSATLEDIMSRLPELSLIKRGPYGMEPSIRNLSDGRINVLIDGMKIHGACTDKMDPVTIYIEPSNLKSLEVESGGTGSFSGSSIGGTINMKKDEPLLYSGKTFSGIVHSGFQTAAKSFYEGVQLNYSTKKFGIKGTTTYRNSSNYRSGGGKIIPFSQFEKINYSLSLKYKLNERLYYLADYIGDKGYNIGYPALPMDVGFASANIGSMSLSYSDNSKKLYTWNLKVYANSVVHKMDDTKRPNVPMHMDMPGESNTKGFYAEASYRINRHQKIDVRIDASSVFLKADMTMYQPGELPMYMLTWPDNRTNQAGIAAKWNVHVSDKSSFMISGRLDGINSGLVTTESKSEMSIFGYEKKRNDFLKSVSAKAYQKAGKNISIISSLSYSERFPTATELYGFYLFNASENYDYIGNPFLNPEKSIQAELTGNYRFGRSNIKLTGYYIHVLDYITGMVNPALSVMTIGAAGVKRFEQIKFADIIGAEGSLFLNVNKNVDVVSTLKYAYGKDSENNPLVAIAPLKSIVSVRRTFNNFYVQAESEMSAAQNRVNKMAAELPTNGFAIFHLRGEYNFAFFKLNSKAQFGVENILDKNYTEHLDWGKIPRQGRNFYIQLKVAF